MLKTHFKKSISVIVCIAMLVVAGCALMTTGPDGTPIVDPEAVAKIDAAAAIAEPAGEMAAALSAFWTPAALIGGILAGAAGAWKKMRPEIEAITSEKELATKAGIATSAAIEEFKQKYPDYWSDLSRFLEEYHGTTVENFYRALRDLPPKG